MDFKRTKLHNIQCRYIATVHAASIAQDAALASNNCLVTCPSSQHGTYKLWCDEVSNVTRLMKGQAQERERERILHLQPTN